MKDPVQATLDRARTELAAVRALRDAGFPEQADSRAYYAAFYAANAALLTLGENRRKHSAVIATFGRLVVKEEGFDSETARALRVLFDLRNASDYDWFDTSKPEGEDPVAIAEPFVEAVAAWIAAREHSQP